MEEFSLEIPEEWDGTRVDRCVSELMGEKLSRSRIQAMIKAGEMAQETGIDFTLTWAPVGEIQQEYSLYDLKKIFVEIQLYVHRFVLQQQLKEQEILAISSKEELLNLDIGYHA